MKKVNLFFLVMMIFIGFTISCGKDSGSTTSISPTEIKEIETIGTNEFGWDIPKETIELTYFAKQQRNPEKERAYTAMIDAYLLDNFNIDITKLQFDTNPDERLNLMLTANDYPAVISSLSKTDLLRLDSLGKIVDLAPYIEALAPNIPKELGDIYGRFIEEDGRILGLPLGWGMLDIPDFSAVIRYDYWLELGSPEIETPEEYYSVLKDMINQHPVNQYGEKVYALSWSMPGPEMIVGINSVAGMWGLKQGYKQDENNNLTHWINTPEGKQFTAFYNQVHRDGLLDPDAFTNKFDNWKTKFSNERIMGHIGYWWQPWNAGHEVWQKLDENTPENKRYVNIPLKAEGAERAYISPKDTTGWGFTAVTDKAENVEEIIKVLDFMMTPMGTRLMAWGVPNDPGSNWNIDENGNWSFVEKAKQEIINATYDYEAHRFYGDNRHWIVHPQGALSDDTSTNAWIDQCFNDQAKWKKILNDNMAGTAYDNSAMIQIVFMPDDPITIVKQQVEDTIQSSWTKTVMSNTEEEFEKNYASMVSQLKKAGVDDLQVYMTEQYKKNLADWSN